MHYFCLCFNSTLHSSKSQTNPNQTGQQWLHVTGVGRKFSRRALTDIFCSLTRGRGGKRFWCLWREDTYRRTQQVTASTSLAGGQASNLQAHNSSHCCRFSSCYLYLLRAVCCNTDRRRRLSQPLLFITTCTSTCTCTLYLSWSVLRLHFSFIIVRKMQHFCLTIPGNPRFANISDYWAGQ